MGVHTFNITEQDRDEEEYYGLVLETNEVPPTPVTQERPPESDSYNPTPREQEIIPDTGGDTRNPEPWTPFL